MKNLVLQGYLNGFAESEGFSDLPAHEIFEAFAASAVLRKYHQLSLSEMKDFSFVGGGSDGGLDAIAILINGRIARTKKDIEFFENNFRHLSASFVFVQAKSSPSFKSSDIGTFMFGVEDFFRQANDSTPRVTFKGEIAALIELAKYIYTQKMNSMTENPSCYLYYVTAGQWTNEVEPKGRFSSGKRSLERLHLFSQVATRPVDAQLLTEISRQLKRGVVKNIELTKSVAFPRIDRVDEAYVGLLSGAEFIRLVSTSTGDLNREIFYDNVRDFQGDNPVNREIDQTLSDADLRACFPLLNNGITIIARSLRRTGDTFQVTDFQIVNGCQTTHMLFRNKAKIGADTLVPVKIVVTDDSKIVADVIKATNRQTVVLPEALESLSVFHKNLEEYYHARESERQPEYRFYYERRSKQYVQDNIHSRNIVTLTAQIKSFIAMFLEEPHSHPRYYGELLRAYQGKIFVDDHKLEPYYVSGIGLLILEQWFNSHLGDRELRSYKYQLLMIFRILVGGASIPKMNSNKIANYTVPIIESLRSPQLCERILGKAIRLLRITLKEFDLGHASSSRNPPHRLRIFTDALKKTKLLTERKRSSVWTGDSDESPKLGERGRGCIVFFDDDKGYGFIRDDRGYDIFVHWTEIREVPYHLRVADQQVTFWVGRSPRPTYSVVATKVQLIRT